MLKDFYKIPKFKELDRVGKVLFVFAFLLPLTIVYIFLHFYFWPFGLNVNYDLDSKEVEFTNRDFFYTIDGERVLDGIAEIKLRTTIPKRNLKTNISVEGENLYLIPEVFKDHDINFTPDFSREFGEDFDYILLDEYEVKEEDLIVFKIDYELDIYRDIKDEILLKYKNLKIIQRNNSVELMVNEILGGEFKTFQTQIGLGFEIPEEKEEERIENVTMYAIYKKPSDTNGFIELFANNRISERVVIPSDEKKYDDMFEIFEIKTVWNEELEKDLSQQYVSLKQEDYTVSLLRDIPEDLRDIVNWDLYYEKLFKPKEFEEEEKMTKELENQECNENEESVYEEVKDYEETKPLGNGFFRYDENFNERFHIFYKKEFFNSFEDKVNKISIGYEYPISFKKEFSTLKNTPMKFTIVGEDSKIENIKINIRRESLWEKF
jgi:hypothetical protein